MNGVLKIFLCVAGVGVVTMFIGPNDCKEAFRTVGEVATLAITGLFALLAGKKS